MINSIVLLLCIFLNVCKEKNVLSKYMKVYSHSNIMYVVVFWGCGGGRGVKCFKSK